MTLDTFFEKFDLFADAPDAVAKMRGLILRLAMQGKLSEPHKGDVPVTDLLYEVEKERAALGIKSERAADNGSLETEFFAIPSRWAWVQFGGLARHNAGKTLDKGRNRGEPRDYITTSNLYWGFFQLNEMRQMLIEDEDLDRCTATKGDLLIVEGGEAGRAAVWCYEYDIAFQNHIHRARFFGGINPYFVQRYFETLNATGDIDKFRKGVGISNMSGKALASIPVPLPPLAEQKRIVAKVDELMALCDRLEAQQQEREAKASQLARASLARFADAPTPANLSYLFHSSFIIHPSDLRKSILTLAVQGKLVPQDPNDEPAEELLERVKAARAALAVERRVRQSDEVEYSRQDQADDAPPGWVEVHVNDVAIVQGGKRLPNGAVFSESPTPHVYIRVTDMKNGTISETGLRYISPEVQREIARYIINKEDLYITIAGTIGDVGCVPESLDGHNLTENAAKIVFRGVDRQFFQLALTSEFVQAQFLEKTKQMAQPKLALKRIAGAKFYLPPLAEQRRIVAKVEQLMALVDALEAQLAASRATASNLLSALVAELT